MTDEPTPDEPTPDEHDLLAELVAVLPPDPMPEGMLDRANGLLTWFGVDDEIAALLERSDELSGTRSAGSDVAIGAFATDDGLVRVELDIDNRPDERTLVGFVSRGDVVAVELLAGDGSQLDRADVDHLGHVEIGRIGPLHGPHRLRLVGRERTVVTDWFVL